MTGSFSGPSTPAGADGSNLDAHLGSEDPLVRMLLSFQRPPRPVGKVLPSLESALEPEVRGGPSSIAPTRSGLQGPAPGGAASTGTERYTSARPVRRRVASARRLRDHGPRRAQLVRRASFSSCQSARGPDEGAALRADRRGAEAPAVPCSGPGSEDPRRS